jgi:branched-chain amino acid transport system permease protein
MQAMSQNREVCKVVGIDARQVALVAFAIGAALAGLAAAFIIPVFVITPDIGANITLRAFATIIVAGMGKVQETLYGAFLLGVTEAFVAGYITSAYAPVAPFLMMIFVLLFRPEGIFGRKVGL